MKKEILADYYEKHHVTGNRLGFVYAGVQRALLFQAWVGTGNKVLDLGCRDGSLTRYYADQNDVTGVDIDREALAACSRNLSIKTIWHDINEELPFSDDSFDVVVAGEVLEHSIYPELVVGQIARVLIPGGLFVGSVPNGFRLESRLKFLVGQEIETDKTHLHTFSRRALVQLFNRHFKLVDLIPIGTHRLIKLSPWLFGLDIVWRMRRREDEDRSAY